MEELTKYSIFSFLINHEYLGKIINTNYILQVLDIKNINDNNQLIRLKLSDGEYSADIFYAHTMNLKFVISRGSLVKIVRYKIISLCEIYICTPEFVKNEDIIKGVLDVTDRFKKEIQKVKLEVLINNYEKSKSESEICAGYESNNNILSANEQIELCAGNSIISKSKAKTTFEIFKKSESKSKLKKSNNNIRNINPILSSNLYTISTLSNLNSYFEIKFRVLDVYRVNRYVLHVIFKDTNSKYGLIHITTDKFHLSFRLNHLYKLENGLITMQHPSHYYKIGYQISVTIKVLNFTKVTQLIDELSEQIPSELECRLITLDEVEDKYIRNNFLIDIVVYILEVNEVIINTWEYFQIKAIDKSLYIIEILYTKEYEVQHEFVERTTVLFKNILIKYNKENKYTLNYAIPTNYYTDVHDLNVYNEVKIFFESKSITEMFIQNHSDIYTTHDDLKYISIYDLKSKITECDLPFNDLGYFMLKAKVINYKCEESYVYNSCKYCKSVISNLNEQSSKSVPIFKCEKCKEIKIDITYAYKLKLTVRDNSEECMYLTLFDNHADKITGMTAQEYLIFVHTSMRQQKRMHEDKINNKMWFILVRVLIRDETGGADLIVFNLEEASV